MLKQEPVLEPQQVPTLIIGNSQQAAEMRTLAKRLGETEHAVLIQGETGTGKEVAAAEIHRNGRGNSPFIPVNCSAITATLFESELFGHKKGSFTGATEDRHGFLESAEDGTIFFDEIGTLPLDFQVKLLRVLQDGIFSPVGDRRQIKMKARVIAGTNVDLRKAMSIGVFRSDLYYRLNVIPFYVPRLRDRPGDVHILAEHFLGHEARRLSASALSVMNSYHWPGNIRQLKNAVSRAVFFSFGSIQIEAEHVWKYLEDGEDAKPNEELFKPVPDGPTEKFPTLREVEGNYFREVLQRTRGNISAAARMAGIERRTLGHKMRRLKLADFVISFKKNHK